MADVAALIADLVTAGVDPALVGRVAAALAEREAVPVLVRDEAAERRREKDRARKRAVCGNPRNSAESAESPPETKVSPEPPSQTQTPTPPYSPPAPPKSPSDIPLADLAEAIFNLQPAQHRGRSSRPDIRDALEVQLKAGANPAAIYAALKAYYATPDAKRDGGQYAKGAHRVIQRGRWKDFAPKKTEPIPSTPEALLRRLQHFRDTGEWRPEWGSKPERNAA